MLSSRTGAFAIAFILLCTYSTVFAETSTTYYEGESGSDTKIVALDGDNEDSSVSIKYPATEVLDASIGIQGLANGQGEYPEDLSLKVKNYEWKYDGQGYGALGYQEKFSSDSNSASANFAGSGETEISIWLPANANVEEASVDISGFPYGSGELDEYRKASVDTNGGSLSDYSDLFMLNDDYYVTWEDDGNLKGRDSNNDNILFRGYINGNWADTVLIDSESGESREVLGKPIIQASDSVAVLTWMSSVYLEASYSYDEGDSWSQPESIGPGKDGGVWDYDVVYAAGNMHFAWSTLSDIYYQECSIPIGNCDGSEAVVISDESGDYNEGVKIDVSDNDIVHVTWVKDIDSVYSTEYIRKEGGSWGSQVTLSSTNDVKYPPETTVSSIGSNVVVSWIEEGSSGDDVIKAKKSSDSGSTFPQEFTIATEESISLQSIDSDNDASSNFFLSWSTYNIDNPRKIMSARGSNSGSTWSTPVNIDGVDNGDINQFRNNPSVGANTDRVIVAWTDEYEGTGASNDADIVYSISTNNGVSWTSMNDISEHYYEADSGAPSLAKSEEYLYMVYLDDGDVDQLTNPNGCDADGRDGDVIFMRSDDGGTSWEDIHVLSIFEGGDNETELVATTLYQDRADVAATGNNVYAVWTDYDTYGGGSKIYYSSSTNQGEDWNTPKTIDGASSGREFGVTIAANGNNIVVSWMNINSYEIYSVSSNDGGSSWNEPMIHDDASSSINYMPEIIFNGGKFHLVWSDSTYGQSVYYTQTTDGNSWSDTIYLNVRSEAYYSYDPVIGADGSKLFAAWTEYGDYDGDGFYDYDIVGAVSTDNGDTWAEERIFVDTEGSNRYMLPSIASGSGFTYLSYQYYSDNSYDYYFAFTQDDGGTWSDSYEITDYDNSNLEVKYHRMDSIVADEVYFAFPEESDISGGSRTDKNLYLRSATSDDYPEDPYVKVSRSQSDSKDWEWLGELNKDNSPKEWSDTGGASSFKNALNEALEDALANGDIIIDDFGNEMVELKLKVGSSSKGTVVFDKLAIQYTVLLEIKSESLVQSLNDISNDAEGDQAEAILILNSETPGKVQLSDLEVITIEAKLSLSDISIEGELIEGNNIYISTMVQNDGEGEASVTIQFSYDSKVLGSRTVSEVSKDNSGKAEYYWKDIPSGSYTLTAEIIDSLPIDSGSDPDTITKSINILEASPDIAYTISFSSEVIEELTTDFSLELENKGEKYADVTINIYWDEYEEDEAVECDRGQKLPCYTPQTKIDKESVKIFEGSLTPSGNYNKLYIKIDDVTEGTLIDEEVEVIVKKLPNLVITKVIWEDEEGNELTSFSDGSKVYPKIYVNNEGSFDISATAQINFRKGGKDLQMNFAGIIYNGFGTIVLPAEEEVVLTFNDAYPSVSFFSGGDSGFEGDWNLEIVIENLKAVKDIEQYWDSTDYKFENSNFNIEISTPPDLSITSFTSSSTEVNEGDIVTLTVGLTNLGGATATGILQFSSIGSTVESEFFIEGEDTKSIIIDYEIPQYDGIMAMKVSIKRESVVPDLDPEDSIQDDTQSLDLTVKGTLPNSEPSKGSSEGGNGNVMVIGGALTLALLASGGGYFYFSRGGSEIDDPFGGMETSSPEEVPVTPSATPPQPEVPPVTPPPPTQQPETPISEQLPAAPQAPQPEVTPAMPPPVQETLMSITVPQGVQPGQQIQVKHLQPFLEKKDRGGIMQELI